MAAKPNILLIVIDDMGVHQLGCYGSSFFETPRIDQLAGAGVRFTCAYSASPVCSPARAALYTGIHPARLHLTNYIPGTEPANPRLLTPPWRAHLPVEIATLGDEMKARGFATGHFGKWHLAPDYHYRPGRPMDPESHGFEHVVVTRKPLVTDDPEADSHHVERLTDEAIRFMSTSRSEPFFCVVAHNTLHRPELAPASLIAKYAAKQEANHDAHRPVVGAMVEQLDRSIGRLLDHLHSSGLAENTLVVFTADHGAFGRSAERKPLRGAKADLFEAGVRVPLLYSWPGRIEPGERMEPVFGTDLPPTLLDLCGLAADGPYDGVSLLPTLSHPAVAPPKRDQLCWHFPHYHHLGLAPCGSIRVGRWKLVEWFERTIGGNGDGPPCELFNLEDDPGEARNLADEEPQRCAELLARLRRWRQDIGAQEMSLNLNYRPEDSANAAPPPPGDPENPFGE
jgi:arylsulfatase A